MKHIDKDKMLNGILFQINEVLSIKEKWNKWAIEMETRDRKWKCKTEMVKT